MTGRLWKHGVAWALAAAFGLAGCDGSWDLMARGRSQAAMPGELSKETPYQPVHVPSPLSELLPRAIQIHEFTAVEKFAAGKQGVNLRIQCTDGFGSRTKAFGRFRFELREFLPAEPKSAGALIRWWVVDLLDVSANKQHWQNTLMLYEFKLECDQPLAPDGKYVLVAAFDSPYTDRLYTERVFVARP